jgi:hypothetical protein
MSRWPHDDPASLAAFYGDPDQGEPDKQLVPVVPPFAMYYAGKRVPHIMFHRKAASALAAALSEIWETCQRSQARIDAARISIFSGAYNPRYVRGYEPGNAAGRTPRWSNHAYGAAIDFDAPHNGFNTGRGTMPNFVVDAFKRQGALWGGDYRGRTDPMHFEFCSRDVAPVAFADVPQADGDSDAAAADAAPLPQGVPTPVTPAGTASGFFGRARNWIVAAASSVGFGGLGALSNWEIAAVVFGFLFLSVVGIVTFIILFFGAEPVRQWVRRHVA